MSFALATPELQASAERFRGFFAELARTFVERDDLLAQIALALLSRQHVLMTGPPGTAKSGIAAAVLGRIVDEHTGQPSVFARQFTESTVQTDLVGPIDFKTLMQTGRTEHFTDEGMLGAVHAFLDEVLDGRDMLLRTTLNVLHERELKQGTKTTAGQIECALMTTNRYLAEVLEGSRETLLAFVDRVAFVSFVPKGFCDPNSLNRVLRMQVGGSKPAELRALLTIQDLDALQGVVDRVMVPDEVCAALSQLCTALEAELATAAKHDPTFFPSRYLSTRAMVRLGGLLKAICVYRAIVHDEPRALEASHEDLALLRLGLLLSGPDYAHLGTLLERETDPRERRQLSILRSEREIFERVLARIPKPTRSAAKPGADLVALRKEVDAALHKADDSGTPPVELMQTAARLAAVSDEGGSAALEASQMLERTLAHLAARALRTGTTAGAGPHETSIDVVAELAELADGLERASSATRPVARWLRGRALRLLLEAAALEGASVGAALDASPGSLESTIAHADRTLAHLEDLHARCAALRAAGAEEPDGEHFAQAMGRAALRVEDELVTLWDRGFRADVGDALARIAPEQLGLLLTALAPTLAAIDASGARLAKLGGRADAIKARVAAPRVEPLVRKAFDRVSTMDRLELVKQVEELVLHLRESGLHGVIPKGSVLCFAVDALVRGERERPPPPVAEHADFEAYRRLRAAEERISLAYTTIELALRINPDAPNAGRSARELVGGVEQFLGSVPPELRARVIELDLARVERAVDLLERWWRALTADVQLEGALARLREARFFHVTRDEGALLRFALESGVVGDVFAEAKERTQQLRARLDQLEADSSRHLEALRRGAADAAWADLLSTPAS